MKNNGSELSEKNLPGYSKNGHDFLGKWSGEYPKPDDKHYRL